MNRNFSMNQSIAPKGNLLPACIGVDEAARLFGWPLYFIPVLLRAGHLQPLGKPTQNARKWFATCELERLSQDPDWLDKAIRLVERHVKDSNEKQRGKAPKVSVAPLDASETRAALN
jgi:hypothetical protein